MDPRQQEALVRRLVQNPQDQAAISEAHAAGQADPAGYATLLEKVGHGSREPALAAHWLNEAANVWLATFNDAHRAATALMAAVEKDPTADAPATRLGELYRQNGDLRALVALYERRAMTIASRPQAFAGGAQAAAALYEELGRLCSEPPISDQEKARDSFTRALELNPDSHFSIYSVRELHKQREEWVRALPYFAMEQVLVHDPSRKLSLYLDEAEVARRAGKPDVAVRALRSARQLDAADPGLKQQLGTLTLEKVRAGVAASPDDRSEACDLFVSLAEQYGGEHGFLYALCALELDARSERACQLVMHYGDPLGRTGEAAAQLQAFIQANPTSTLVGQAHQHLAGAVSGPPAVAASGAPAVAASADPAVAASGAPAIAASQAAVRPSGPARPAPVTMSRPEAGEDIDTLLQEAAQFAKKSRKTEAITAYQKVLHLDPANEEAIAYLQQQLPPKRKYAELRDVLWTAAEVQDADVDKRIAWLGEAATLCERQLKDFDGAAAAWRLVLDIDAENEAAREQYKRLLERARRWDDLAELLREEAEGTEDIEVRISIEKNLAKLHNDKRKDPASAGQAWGRIAAITPGDEIPLLEAVKHLERAERFDLAADVIAEHVAAIEDTQAQHELYAKLGRLRAESNDLVGAADALSDGAMKLKDPAMWATAEKYYSEAESWQQAAGAALERIEFAKKDAEQAELNAIAARYLFQAGEEEEAFTRLERAVELAPDQPEFADELEQRLTAAGRVEDVARIFLTRADKLEDVSLRVELRRRAAVLQRDRLDDVDAARASFVLVLRDQEDPETLAWLADDAEGRGDFDSAVRYLYRLGAAVEELDPKRDALLREAAMHAGELDRPEIAIERYEKILSDVDPKCETALERVADIHIGRGDVGAAAEALERLLELAEGKEKRLEVSRQLADLYEHKLERSDDAMRVLEIVHSADPDDFDATERLCSLAENAGRWPLFAELMVELISVEGDESEVSSMTRRLAEVLHVQLGDGDEALNVLGGVADAGDLQCRNEFIALGDQLNKKDIVARRMVVWFKEEPPSPEREDTLHGAFERLMEVGEKREAAEVAKLLAASRQLRPDVAETVEEIGVELSDLDAIAAAHALRAAALSGAELAAERVRQAEVLAEVGVAAADAVAHGEQALAGLGPEEVEPLLARLSALLQETPSKIEVYERQVMRCTDADARLAALCRAAEVAAELGDTARAHGFFEVVLSGGIEEKVISRLVSVARAADHRQDGKALRTILAESLAASGQGVRDGGKTRGLFLRRAAILAFEELDEPDRSLGWLSDALVTYVDDETLDALEELAENLDDFKRAEAIVGRALEEVFDGPMVRRLLGRRAAWREERLKDPKAAADDLKKLLDLSPSQSDIADRLAELYTRLEDYRGLVQLHEDQILRGRDKEKRAHLARLVARIWQDQLKDPRETADAWRRVLRMASGDEEAKEGLARAKEAMLAARAEPSLAEAAPVPSSPSAAEPSRPRSSATSAAKPVPPSQDDPSTDDEPDEEAANAAAPEEAEASSESQADTSDETADERESEESADSVGAFAAERASDDSAEGVPDDSAEGVPDDSAEGVPDDSAEGVPDGSAPDGGASAAAGADEEDAGEGSSVAAEAALALGAPSSGDDEPTVVGDSLAFDSQAGVLTPPPGALPTPPSGAVTPPPPPGVTGFAPPPPPPPSNPRGAAGDNSSPFAASPPFDASEEVPASEPEAAEPPEEAAPSEVDVELASEPVVAGPPPKPVPPAKPSAPPRRSGPPPPPPRRSAPPPIGAAPPPPPRNSNPGAPPPPMGGALPAIGAAPPPPRGPARAASKPPPPPPRNSRRPPPPPPRNAPPKGH
jgi:tetratricopeptide (TPR) repeat protein